MKLRSVLFIAAVAAIFSSCGVDDLEDRLDKLENSIGSDEPLNVDFKTTNSDDVAITKKTSFLFKSIGRYTGSIRDNQDGTFDVYIERFGDVDWNEGAWIEFEYDETTKETSDEQAGIYFYDQFNNYTGPTFYPDYTGNTFLLTIKSINVATGDINVSVSASTDATAVNNEFSEKPMSSTFSFKGKLDVIIND
ncbi:MAG TPA: hypothetical protein PLJ60_03915 [Chryseolinea sp.]|nr:hypothetical protein [Chryseolinea sp.]HPM29462.1 hypothetical protein [Chryseolinea sp.]